MCSETVYILFYIQNQTLISWRSLYQSEVIIVLGYLISIIFHIKVGYVDYTLNKCIKINPSNYNNDFLLSSFSTTISIDLYLEEISYSSICFKGRLF